MTGNPSKIDSIRLIVVNRDGNRDRNIDVDTNSVLGLGVCCVVGWMVGSRLGTLRFGDHMGEFFSQCVAVVRVDGDLCDRNVPLETVLMYAQVVYLTFSGYA
jgi:hypothetical protein